LFADRRERQLLARLLRSPAEVLSVTGIVGPTQRAGTSLDRNRIMIWGMSAAMFTLVHVVISLIGILSGFIVVFGLLKSSRLPGWTAIFLLTTILTSVTGFGFPFDRFLPSHWVGVISLVVLAVALLALYVFRLSGPWRWIYVIAAMLALYLNVFVAVVQSFLKVSFLKPLAPTQSEPPFLVAQIVVMAIFIVLGVIAVRRFHPAGSVSA
jgi:hypothetical protein